MPSIQNLTSPPYQGNQRVPMPASFSGMSSDEGIMNHQSLNELPYFKCGIQRVYSTLLLGGGCPKHALFSPLPTWRNDRQFDSYFSVFGVAQLNYQLVLPLESFHPSQTSGICRDPMPSSGYLRRLDSHQSAMARLLNKPPCQPRGNRGYECLQAPYFAGAQLAHFAASRWHQIHGDVWCQLGNQESL